MRVVIDDDANKRPGMASRTTAAVFIVGLLVTHSLWYEFYLASRHHIPAGGRDTRQTTARPINATLSATPSAAAEMAAGPRCAICLFGLPRAFDSLVLPSLFENVLQPNARHQCDYFVHYYNVTHEAKGRSGVGGFIRPDDVLHLAAAVERVAAVDVAAPPPLPLGHRLGRPVALFRAETADGFWKRRGALVDKVRTANDTQGRFLYFPWKDTTYQHPTTTDNILKMWHSIHESWDLMRSHADEEGIEYSRVAMLRSDVFYLTPIDVWELPTGGRDNNNSVVVIPGFGKYPVSDRLIYGPAAAVQIWATERFERMEPHVQWVLRHNPGYGLHSEIFVRRALLEPIRKLGFRVEEHPTMCFFRARADESIWTSDCSQAALRSVSAGLEEEDETGLVVVDRVERILRRTCQNVADGPSRTTLTCATGPRDGTKVDTANGS
jgi:hypothetical protein